VENRWLWERYLDLRVYGRPLRRPRPLARPSFDLVAAMKRHAQATPLPLVRQAPPSNSVLYFD
jgi:hypothetical protein